MQDGFIGLEEIKLKKLNVYPNPTTEEINIDISKAYEGKFYSILNNSGQVVQSGTFSIGANKLELNKVTPGFYYLQILGEDKPIKIIKH